MGKKENQIIPGLAAIYIDQNQHVIESRQKQFARKVDHLNCFGTSNYIANEVLDQLGPDTYLHIKEKNPETNQPDIESQIHIINHDETNVIFSKNNSQPQAQSLVPFCKLTKLLVLNENEKNIANTNLIWDLQHPIDCQREQVQARKIINRFDLDNTDFTIRTKSQKPGVKGTLKHFKIINTDSQTVTFSNNENAIIETVDYRDFCQTTKLMTRDSSTGGLVPNDFLIDLLTNYS